MGITFTGGSLDRSTEHRSDPDWLAAQAADPAARAVVAAPDAIYVTGDDRLALVPLDGMPTSVLLGRDADFKNVIAGGNSLPSVIAPACETV